MICPTTPSYVPSDVLASVSPKPLFKGDLMGTILKKLDDNPFLIDELDYLLEGKSYTNKRLAIATALYVSALKRGVIEVKEDSIITVSGEQPLIPFTPSSTPKVFSSRIQAYVRRLSRSLGIDVVTYVDTKDRRKGYFTPDTVYLNLAHATESTPLHEFYHPFVRVIKNENPALWDDLLNRAKIRFPNLEDEEAVVEMLAVMKTYETLFQRVKNYVLRLIRRLLGLDLPLKDIRTLGELLRYLDEPLKSDLRLSDLEIAYSLLDDEKINTFDLADALQLWSDSLDLRTDDTLDHYVNKEGAKVARRVTHFVGDRTTGAFTRRSKVSMSYAEHLVRQIFQRRNKPLDSRPIEEQEEVIEIDGKQVSAKDLYEKTKVKLEAQRAYGKMVHAFLQYLNESDKVKAVQWADEVRRWLGVLVNNGLIELQDADVYLSGKFPVESIPILAPYKKATEDILAQLGLEASQIKLFSEITLMSDGLLTDEEGLPIAGTADLVIVTQDNELILVDWKTGNVFSDAHTGWLMPYGEKFLVNDSKLSRDSMALVMRAMMIKEHFPEAKFKGVYIAKLSKFKRHYLHQVNLEDFLPVIENYYRENNKLDNFKNRKDIFDARQYRGVPTYIVQYRELYADVEPSLRLKFAYQKLKQITSKYSKDIIDASSDLREEVAFWTKVIAELESIEGVNVDYNSTDLPDLLWQLKGFTDVGDPKVSTLAKVLNERKLDINHEYQELMREHDRLAREVIRQKDNKFISVLRKLNKIPLLFGIVTANPFIAIPSIAFDVLLKHLGVKTMDVFGFMWVKHEGPEKVGWFLNTSDTHNGRPLTEAEKAYRDFFKENIHKLYAKVANSVVLDAKDKPVALHTVLGLPKELPDDFVPRIPKTLAEMREEENFFTGFGGVKSGLQYFFRRFMTDYIDSFVSEQPNTTIALKYVVQDDSAVISAELHSMDPTKIFALFASNALTKYHLDDVLSLALGMRAVFNQQKDFKGNKLYPNFVKWLDSQLDLQFPTRRVPSKYLSRPFTISGKVSKLLGLPEGKVISIDPGRLSELLRIGVAHSVMGFRLMSAFKNAILITIVNAMQATEGRISSILGVPPDRFSPNAKGLALGYADLIGLFKDYMLGSYRNNKLYLMAKEFDFLPDNYTYHMQAAKTDDAFSTMRNAGFLSYAFMFQNLAETYGAYMHLAMIARSMKLQNAKGEEFTLWDAYEVKDGKLVWTKGPRGVVLTKEGEQQLNELTALEIKGIKRLYEMLHGSYRREEAIAIEANIFGQFLVQFKKYYFRYLKELGASKYTDYSVGQFVKREDIKRPDGMPVWEWEAQVMEGRIRTLAGAISALLYMGSDKGIRSYLRDEYKARSFAKLLNTAVWLLGLLLVYGTMFDDDDDKYAAKWAMRIIRDASRGLHPMDVVDFIKTPILAASKAAEFGTALWLFFTRGLWEGPTRSGYPLGAKTILRSLPGTSSAMQLQDLFLSSDTQSLPWR